MRLRVIDDMTFMPEIECELSHSLSQVGWYFDNEFGSSKLKSMNFSECEESLEFLKDANRLVLRNLIDGYDPSSSDLFSRLIERLVGVQGDLSTLAGMLSVSVSTVHRWKNGNSTPHLLMRESIKSHLQEKFSTALKH